MIKSVIIAIFLLSSLNGLASPKIGLVTYCPPTISCPDKYQPWTCKANSDKSYNIGWPTMFDVYEQGIYYFRKADYEGLQSIKCIYVTKDNKATLSFTMNHVRPEENVPKATWESPHLTDYPVKV